MGLFSKKTKEELYIEKEMKKVKKDTDLAIAIAEYAAKLAGSKDVFERTITLERLNVLERRKNRVSDAACKERIHDAAVGLLAVQEAEFELRSVSNARELESAMKSLEKVLKCMYRLDPGTSITKGEVRKSRGLEFDDTAEPVTYADRAALVDERFVENLIQGESLESCLEQTVPRTAGNNMGSPAPGMDGINFYDTSEADKEFDALGEKLSQKYAGER